MASVISALFSLSRLFYNAPNVCFAEWSIWDFVCEGRACIVSVSERAAKGNEERRPRGPFKQFSNVIISLSAGLSTKSLCLVFESLIKAIQCRSFVSVL